jgi:hypothetical protein
MDDQKSIDYWIEFLNERAKELGLSGTVKGIAPINYVGVISFVLEEGDELVDLGWSIEEAEASLRQLALQ